MGKIDLDAIVLQSNDDSTVEEVMTVIRAASGDGLEDWEASEDYIRSKICDSKNIGILLRDRDRAAGFVLAIPHNDAVVELQDADPLMIESSDNRFYVDVVAVVPDYQRLNGGIRLVGELIQEASRRCSANQFSMHVRVSTGLSQAVQTNVTSAITTLRRVERWKYYAGELPSDYIELTL